jgi:hypothetical protein
MAAKKQRASKEKAAKKKKPRGVTREMFLAWRSPRFGSANPEKLTNPVWRFIIDEHLDAYGANKRFDGPSSFPRNPCFSSVRFGQSVTSLPDGRTIFIGGEHEDYYDPDFFIYNDVFVKDVAGNLEIYGYPRDLFPPTDFHSATLVGSRIVVIGALGHAGERYPGTTQIHSLDVTTMAMTRLESKGDAPGWIFEHAATLVDDARSIVVRDGKRAVIVAGEEHLRDNIDDWSLDLASLVWTRLTDRRYATFEIARADGKRNHLWEIGEIAWAADGHTDFHREQLEKGIEELGYAPDLEVYASRYSPPFSHETCAPNEDHYNFFEIKIDGVLVRFVEESSVVCVTVRGAVDEEKIATLVEHARKKIEMLERHPCEVKRIEG